MLNLSHNGRAPASPARRKGRPPLSCWRHSSHGAASWGGAVDSIEPEPSSEPESDPFAAYYMTPEQIQEHEKAEVKRREQALAKQMASLRGDLSVSTSAALAGLSTAATADSLADAFNAVAVFGSPADVLLLAEAEAIGIDVKKVNIKDLRVLGTGRLFELKQRQDLLGSLFAPAGAASAWADVSKASTIASMDDALRTATGLKARVADEYRLSVAKGLGIEQVASLRGDLTASAGISSALTCLNSTTSAASALVDTVGAVSALAGYQTCADYAAEAQLLEKAQLLGIDVGKMSSHDLRTLGADGLMKAWQERELSKLMASVRGDLTASTGISSAMADLTSKNSAASALVDVFGSVSAVASISDAMDAIARHGSGFESAWLSVHTGGVDQYAKELARLIQPLASIRGVVGTWDGLLAPQFEHLAGTSTYLQASGVEAGELLKFAWEPANRDAEPDVIARRFRRKLEDEDEYTEIIPLQPQPVWFHSPVHPTGDSNLKKLVAELKTERDETRAELAEVKAALAQVQATMDAVVSCLPKLTSPPAALAGAEVVQTEKTPATPSNAIPAPDFAKLATREALIEAFGKFTEMNASWFVKLGDTPALLAARKVTGQGGRNNAAPLFCPFEVMQWLINPNRRKGNPMQPDTGWRMLELHFPLVYHAHSVCDPRQD